MVAFYKHHIADWMDGTAKLSCGAYRVYHVVCQLIYLHEGPITLHERGLAGQCNQSMRVFRKYLAELVAAGKITIENGMISNGRAVLELENVKKYRRTNSVFELENSSKSRETSSKSRETSSKSQIDDRNPLKNNDASKNLRARARETRLDYKDKDARAGARVREDAHPPAQGRQIADVLPSFIAKNDAPPDFVLSEEERQRRLAKLQAVKSTLGNG